MKKTVYITTDDLLIKEKINNLYGEINKRDIQIIELQEQNVELLKKLKSLLKNGKNNAYL